MDTPLYHLNFNRFDSLAPKTLWKLADDKHFVDVSIIANDGEPIDGHKAILASSSTLLNRMLTSNSHTQPMIFLAGMKYEHLKLMIEFVYKGECMVPASFVDEFLRIGKQR